MLSARGDPPPYKLHDTQPDLVQRGDGIGQSLIRDRPGHAVDDAARFVLNEYVTQGNRI